MGSFKGEKGSQKIDPKAKKDLIDQMSELWNNIGTDFRQNLSNSIPKRLSEVIRNKGKQTSY